MSQTAVGVTVQLCADRWHGDAARELVFARTDNQRWHLLPGQHIALTLALNSQNYVRYYSVLGLSHNAQHLHILVKKGTSGGAAGYLCHDLPLGAELTLTGPQGDFTARRYDVPMTFLAAGSGVVPLFSIFAEAIQQGASARTFILADQSQHTALLWPQLQHLVAQQTTPVQAHSWWVQDRGLPTLSGLLPLLAPGSAGDLYFCGPTAFCALATRAALAAGYPPDRMHTETMG